MSRTIRRNRDKKKNKTGRRYFGCVEWWTHESVRGEDGAWKRVKLEGNAYWKGYWRYHSDVIKDWAYPKWLRNNSHREARSKNKVEIIRYYKDKDYEVMEHWPRDLSWDV